MIIRKQFYKHNVQCLKSIRRIVYPSETRICRRHGRKRCMSGISLCNTGPVPVRCPLRTRGKYSTTARAEAKKNDLPCRSHVLIGSRNTRRLHMWKRWNGTVSVSSYRRVRDTGGQNFLHMAANQSWLGRSVRKILIAQPDRHFICDMPPFLIVQEICHNFIFFPPLAFQRVDGRPHIL